jgi:eukaryotic-like serine/threonine-protein kinase
MTNDTEFRPGDSVGPYLLEALIGTGGMGRVFRAVDTRLHRTVAIKVMLPSDVATAANRRRFLQEARAASALNHPNIAAIHDISSQDGIDFLVMEHVAGETLENLIPTEGMAFDMVVKLGSQVASALAAAHAAGIVHRDIKPANIMVTQDQQVKVLDFGVAKMISGALHDPEGPTGSIVEVTIPGAIVGTVSYMSPEQTHGAILDERSDIFSLGCVLYQAATGRLPFRGASTLAIMHEIATSTPVSPGSLRPELPHAFDRLIAACLEKSPKERPSSAGEVARELKRLTSSQDPTAAIRMNRPSIAVIPFYLRTPAAEDEFLCISLADAVIHRLLSTGRLLVRPIASVTRYKGTETEWTQVARDLNVDLVVEGTIQKMGTKVRVLVHAHRMSDAKTLHSGKHDGDLEDLFGLQDRIADSVSNVFVPQDKQSDQSVVPPTKNPLAFELYMRAVDRLAHWNKFEMSSAVEMLSRVVELDPFFADAWGRLAQAYAQIGMHLDPDPQWFVRAEQAIAKTLELDPVQCDALYARGIILWSPSRGFKNGPALRAVNAALKINSGRYQIRQFRGAILFHLGFYAEAQRDLEEAIQLNPGQALTFQGLGMVEQYRGNISKAYEFNQRALDLDPALVHANIFAPLNPLLMDRIGEARDKIQKARQMVPEEPQLTSLEGLISAMEGNFKRAEQLADEASAENRKSVTHTHHSWHYAAGIYAMCGKRDKAILQLRRCAEMGLPNYLLFTTDPFLRAIRDDPEFTALMSDLRKQYDQYRQEFAFAGSA